MTAQPPETRLSSIRQQLEQSRIYRLLRDGNVPAVTSLVEEAVDFAFERSKLTLVHMPQYTLHDENHLFRVLYLMDRLIPEEVLAQLNTPELMLLILAAFFHDLGMAPSGEEIAEWKQAWQLATTNPGTSATASDFARFLTGYPDLIKQGRDLVRQNKLVDAENLRQDLISDYIRRHHADRAIALLDSAWNGRIVYDTKDLTPSLSLICKSHCLPASSLQQLDSSCLCGENTFACLPFVGVILRLADILDFDSKRAPAILMDSLSLRSPTSIAEWKKHRSVQAWSISPSQIIFAATCTHPGIEAAIHAFCDQIDVELRECALLLRNLSDNLRHPFPDHYAISFPVGINRAQIRADVDLYGKPKYIFKSCRFTLSQSEIISLLMGTNGSVEISAKGGASLTC